MTGMYLGNSVQHINEQKHTCQRSKVIQSAPTSLIDEVEKCWYSLTLLPKHIPRHISKSWLVQLNGEESVQIVFESITKLGHQRSCPKPIFQLPHPRAHQLAIHTSRLLRSGHNDVIFFLFNQLIQSFKTTLEKISKQTVLKG